MKTMDLFNAPACVKLLSTEECTALCKKLGDALGDRLVTHNGAFNPDGCKHEFSSNGHTLVSIDFHKSVRWEAFVDACALEKECPSAFDDVMTTIAEAILRGYYADLCVKAGGALSRTWFRIVGAYEDDGFHRITYDRMRVVLAAYGMLDVGGI